MPITKLITSPDKELVTWKACKKCGQLKTSTSFQRIVKQWKNHVKVYRGNTCNTCARRKYVNPNAKERFPKGVTELGIPFSCAKERNLITACNLDLHPYLKQRMHG